MLGNGELGRGFVSALFKPHCGGPNIIMFILRKQLVDAALKAVPSIIQLSS